MTNHSIIPITKTNTKNKAKYLITRIEVAFGLFCSKYDIRLRSNQQNVPDP